MMVMNIHKSVYEQAPYVLLNVHITSQACIYLTKHILKRTEENRTPTPYVLLSFKKYTPTKTISPQAGCKQIIKTEEQKNTRIQMMPIRQSMHKQASD